MSPLIETKINVKNINFNSINILPGEDGELYLINPANTQYERLNVSISKIVNSSPYISYVLGSNMVFIGKEQSNKIVLDINTGFKVSTFLNRTDVISLNKVDYKLQLINKIEGKILWDITKTQITFDNEEKYDNYSKYFSFQNDYEIMKENKEKGISVYKIEGGRIINLERVLEISNSSDKDNYSIQGENFRIKDGLDKLFIYTVKGKILLGIIILVFIFIIRGNIHKERQIISQENKEESLNEDEKQKENILHTSIESISQLSTKSVMSSDFDNKNMSLSDRSSSMRNFRYYFYTHKFSAPEIKSEMELFFSKDSLNIFHRESEPLSKLSKDYCNLSLNDQDELLSPFKIYRMEKSSHKGSDTNSAKLIKQKFNPTEEEKKNFIKLEKEYQLYLENNRHNIESNDYKFQIEESEITHNIDGTVKKNLSLITSGRFMNTFENIEIIGKGRFGCVFKGKHKIDRSYYAIKVIKFHLGENEDISQTDVAKKVKTMMKVEHKKIIRYITCWFELENSDIQNIQDKDDKNWYPIFFFVQMELCNGISLSYFLLNKTKRLSKHLITYLFGQITSAVQHIHSKQIIHCSLKPENIFIHDEFKIKVGDFGLPLDNTYPQEKAGGFLYQAPEQIRGEEYDNKVDIYGLGLILLELCLEPQKESERESILINVREMVYPDEIKLNQEFTDEFNLIKKMTKSDHHERITIEEVIYSEEMSRMINKM